MKILRIVLPLLGLGILVYSIINLPPPKSLIEASFLQIVYFFLPLFFFFTTLMNLIYKNILRSLVVGLGITLLIFLQGLGALNFVSATITILSIIILSKVLKKVNINLPKIAFLKKRPTLTPDIPIKPNSIRRLKINTSDSKPKEVRLKRLKSSPD